ncbi:MAG: hypothetical protein RJB60_2336 [Pseudomonadota bacterium]|jgi:uncharacterized surface protein with fasciclin (FAS1) repeats
MIFLIRTPLAATLAALALISVTGCATTGTGAQSITAATAQIAELSTFSKLVQQAGLSETLDTSEVTVLAPTDAAFKEVPAATLDKLAKDPALLKSVLNYHVLPGKVTAASVTGASQVATLNGAKINLSKAGDFLVADEGMVTTADVPAGKGLVQVIDRVLMPPVKK